MLPPIGRAHRAPPYRLLTALLASLLALPACGSIIDWPNSYSYRKVVASSLAARGASGPTGRRSPPEALEALADRLARLPCDLAFASGLEGPVGDDGAGEALREALGRRGRSLRLLAADAPDGRTTHALLVEAALAPALRATGRRFQAGASGAATGWIEAELETAQGPLRLVFVGGWDAEPVVAAAQAGELAAQALAGPAPVVLRGAPPPGSLARAVLEQAGLSAHPQDAGLLAARLPSEVALSAEAAGGDAPLLSLLVPAPR